MRSREKILKDIISMNDNLSHLEVEISHYPWDIEKPLILLKNNDVVEIFRKSLVEDNIFNDLVKWANLIECREDIDFETDALQEYIFEIANPDINGNLTRSRVHEIIIDLEMSN